LKNDELTNFQYQSKKQNPFPGGYTSFKYPLVIDGS